MHQFKRLAGPQGAQADMILRTIVQLGLGLGMKTLAEGVEARTAPIFLPYLSGERTPHNDATARGVFFGLSTEHGRAELAYSVMEGVAFAMADGNAALRSAGTQEHILQQHGVARKP